MTTHANCGKCGISIVEKAKFCPSCGAKVEKLKSDTEVSLSSVTEWLRANGEENDFGVFRIVIETLEGRSQLIFALPGESADGDEQFDDVQIWSPFAPVERLNVKKVVERMENEAFGFVSNGGFYSLATAIRPWQLRNIDAFIWHVTRLAVKADQLEAHFLGTDEL